ncbi:MULTISPECIES: flavin reductase family protein [unclassified Mycobacterium]|uniref:flavin reductase family protein n=1 Tax=unclassified Mycobacterium TaxID=2642494 RepID=UPI0007FF1D07|nr:MULTISPECIES: flavin reductase family protein [unclassified Mycobacterium]OBH03468.1 oxidoreductase [Mycobacterium sp. E2699]OBI55127.1 oxidoreductase [Mycobacterium sp. E787]
MAMLDGPVFIVTTQADGQPSGCLISFATQTSVQPPSFMVAIPRSSGACEAARSSEHLAVHVLAQHQVVLAELFENDADDQADKFARCSWRAGPRGMPILDEAIAWFVGRTAYWIDIGDHVGYIVEPVGGWAPESYEDVLYLSDLDDLEPGHEAPERFVLHKPSAEPRKYGIRFTLDGPV